MTTDDERTAARRAAWEASPQGRCLRAATEALAASALAGWPAKGRTVLEVNCGTGLLQHTLRGMGLDVTGCEPSPALREHFAAGLGYTFVVDPAHGDLLPYGDKSFDWVVVHLEYTGRKELAKTLQEARRVALAGVAVLVWNTFPLLRRKGFADGPMEPVSALSVYRILRAWHAGRVRAGGRFFFPSLPMCTHAAEKPKAAGESSPNDRVSYKRKGMEEGQTQGFAPARHRVLCRAWDWLCEHMPAGLVAHVSLVRIDFPPSRPLTARPLRFAGLNFAGSGSGLAQGCSERKLLEAKADEREGVKADSIASCSRADRADEMQRTQSGAAPGGEGKNSPAKALTDSFPERNLMA